MPLTSAFCDPPDTMLNGQRYVLCSDFNYKGTVNRPSDIDDLLADVLLRYNMVQQVNCATLDDGNLLDLIITHV
jgi:hypothetical protein